MVVLLVAVDLLDPLPIESANSLGLVRRAPEKTFVGDKVLVELVLSNEGKGVERLVIDDVPPSTAKVVRGSLSLDCGLKARSSVTLRYEVVFREPGGYTFGTTRITLRSMFGLSEKTLVFYAPFAVRVYPKLLSPKLSPIRAKAFGWSGTTPSTYRGGRLQFMNIREYVSGDRISDVNWKASARFGKRLVNEWQVERGLDCVVIVDLFSDDVPRVGDWSARGDVIEAAYEITDSFVAYGNRVGMLIMGRNLHKVKPGFGLRRLRAMVEGLIDSEEGEVWNLEYAEEFLERFFRRQYVKRGGTLFFVSAGTNMRLLNTVAALSGRGFVCNSVVVDAIAGESEALGESVKMKDEELALGRKVARAELTWFEGRLSAHANVYEWSRYRGLSELRRRGK